MPHFDEDEKKVAAKTKRATGKPMKGTPNPIPKGMQDDESGPIVTKRFPKG